MSDRVAEGAAELGRAVDLLVRRVGHWGAARWSARVGSGAEASRAEAVHALVQRLADLGADAEGEPRRAVPRLDNDLALIDQLRVVAADLAAVAPAEVLARAATDVTDVRTRL